MDETSERRGRPSSSSSSYSISESAMFSQRIVCVDFYSAPPIRDMDVMYSEFRGYEVKRVPVIRIYGSTPKGQKTCTHVHCVFPYIYIPDDPSVENLEYRLAIALDQAINLAIGTKDAKNVHHIFKIIKVTGMSMYGFHSSNETFLKMFFYNPWMIKKAAELLQNGAILNKKFQPFEAHIPYQLQFLIDYNLYGMNLVHFSSVKFRRGAESKATYCVSPSSSSLLAFTAGGGQKVWDINQIPEYLCAPLSLDKMTKSELEVDVLGSDILVTSSKSGVRSSNPGIDAIWMDEMERRRQGEVENWSQITIPESQNRSCDKKRFPAEEEHMKTLLNNMAMFPSGSVEEQPDESASFDSQTFLPSSQLNRHTPSNITFAAEVCLTSTAIKPNRADEDLLNLLYEMENEKQHEEEIEEIGSSLGSQVVDVEDPHVEPEESEPVDVEDSWSDSFLSNTLIDEMLDNADKTSDTNTNVKDGNTMVQMDGQDDGDSSDEKEKPEQVKRPVGRPRRSIRLSVEPNTTEPKTRGRKKKTQLEEVDEYPPTPPKGEPPAPKSKPVVKRSAPAKLIAAAATSPRTFLLRKSTSASINPGSNSKGSEAIALATSPQKSPPVSRSSSPAMPLRSSPRISLKSEKQDSKLPTKIIKSISNTLKVKHITLDPLHSATSKSDLTPKVALNIKAASSALGEDEVLDAPLVKSESVASPSRMSRRTPATNTPVKILEAYPLVKSSSAAPDESLDAPLVKSESVASPSRMSRRTPATNTPVKVSESSPLTKLKAELEICLIPCDRVMRVSPMKADDQLKNIDKSVKPKMASIQKKLVTAVAKGRPSMGFNPLPFKKTKIEFSSPKQVNPAATKAIEKNEGHVKDRLLKSLDIEIVNIDEDEPQIETEGKVEPESKFYVLETDVCVKDELFVTHSPDIISSEGSSYSNDQISRTEYAGKPTSEKEENLAAKNSTNAIHSSEITVSFGSDKLEELPVLIDESKETNNVIPIPVIVKEFSDVSCQTEMPDLPVFGPICRCLSEMAKTFKDQGLDAQADLIKKEVKKIQTEMGDILAEMKRNGDRLTGYTPSKKHENNSPRTPTQSRRAKYNETPTSSKYINPGAKVPTPRLSPNSSIYSKYSYSGRTPSPRKALRRSSTSPSPKTQNSPKSSSLSSRYRHVSIGRIHGKKASPWKSLTTKFDQVDADVDMSVNSIYEYSTGSTPDNNDGGTESQQVMSQFQRRRSETRARTWNRVQNRKAKLLLAYNLAPDICEFEFEPMKVAPSYKVLEKWLLTKDKRPDPSIAVNIESEVKKTAQKFKEGNEDASSDEECIALVRRAPGGNLSDEDDDDGLNDTCVNIVNSSNINVASPTANSQYSCSSSLSNPRSILKMSSCRRLNDKAKRKIRWEDEEPLKRSKTEELRKEAIIRGASPLPLSQTSWTGFGNISELDGPSPKNMFGFEHNMSNLQDAKALHHYQYLTTMCVELHCEAREDFVPDPSQDAIQAIFVYIVNDVPESYKKPRRFSRHLIVDVDESIKSTFMTNHANLNIDYFPDEISMINGFVSLFNEWNPDILVGYEIQKQSWGYILERGAALGMNMLNEFSRVVARALPRNQETKIEAWNEMIAGRIVLNLWRLLRHEITVQSYTYENAAYHILHKRVHLFSYKQLTSYWSDPLNRYKVFAFYSERTKGAMDIIEKLDLINRNSELARLFGIQFYEVLSRGSQFRVESMMLRIAKPKNFVPASPSISQRAKMRAPEFLPLILEPSSKYYTDPVAVLDFQSLYPSMIIAYNYCYTTCLGRVEHLGTPGTFDFGCLEQSVPNDVLKRLQNNIHISPAGVAFVDSSITKGILPEMLEQILDTRQMVKRAMKRWKGEDESLLKILDSRQLGLKLIANVTYGYTSANFSGRMPCVDIADSVVSKGRETLTRAIELVKTNYGRWKADVVYGDTDSLFVRFIGRTRQEAFVLAQEIVDEVTQTNPKPVKLKLEKIYQPCILQSKKRYVGYAYETPDQEEPKYDAKGIETVRRDGCPAVKKILEKSIHMLFRTNSVANVQHYVESQFQKIFLGRVSLQEFTFAREYRGRTGYKPTACVPSLEIAKKIIQKDPRAEPLPSQRVPYVIVYGNPRLPLIQLVQTPLDFVKNPNLRLNAHYYIEKAIIPALNRCLLSAKMDAHKWYANLPRKYLRSNTEPKDGKQGTLAHYFTNLNCLRCDGNTLNKSCICDACRTDGIATALYLQNQCYDIVEKTHAAQKICQKCSEEYNKCVNTDCPLFHKLIRYERDEEKGRRILSQLQSLDW